MDTQENSTASATEPRTPDVGFQITRLRLQRQWSQRQLARNAGLWPQRLATLEKGKGRIHLEELLKLTRALGVGLEELVFGPDAGRKGEGRP
jgi:transcriptional regulator with XRE-family HTH domain